MRPGKPVFWLYKAQTFSAKVSDMRFSRNSKKWVAGLLGASLALPLVGCSPEASTTATKPGPAASTGTTKHPKEQAGSTLGGSSAEKGREVPEPNPADAQADDKPADEKPTDEKPKEE
jgi:hypothetical protein